MGQQSIKELAGMFPCRERMKGESRKCPRCNGPRKYLMHRIRGQWVCLKCARSLADTASNSEKGEGGAHNA